MFRYGGPIKEGVMSGIREPRKNGGPAGMGLACYPKVSGNSIEYTIDRLQTYRDGIEVGPNSALMIMMARPLSDTDIENLAEYLKEAKR